MSIAEKIIAVGFCAVAAIILIAGWMLGPRIRKKRAREGDYYSDETWRSP